MEAKALHEQNQARASGFPFHNFSSSSFDFQVLCYSCHGNVLPAPCQSSQILSSPSPTTDSSSHVSPSEPTPMPTPPQNGKANDEFHPYISSFADEFKFK